MIPLAARLAALAAAVCALAGAAQARDCEGTPSDAKVRVVVEGLRSAKGEMTSTLYGPDEAKFLKKGGSLRVWRVPAEAPTTQTCVWLPGPGRYAIAVYHDSISAGRLVLGRLGPVQPFGFSNNPHLYFAPPKLAQVAFAAGPGETTLHIHLHNPLLGGQGR